MTTAIMQPYLFPYLGYWQLINSVDTFVIYDDVNFIKKGFINRNSILINNKINTFTLEVQKQSQNKLINELKIGSNKTKLLKTIQRAYVKSPHFEIIFPIIEEILNYKEDNLAKFIGNSLKVISKYLELDTKFIYSSDIEKKNTKGEEKIIEICKKLNSTRYINPIGGKELYNKSYFNENQIELFFLDSYFLKYKQFNNDFIHSLSIIDIMAFNSKFEISKMLNNFKLI